MPQKSQKAFTIHICHGNRPDTKAFQVKNKHGDTFQNTPVAIDGWRSTTNKKDRDVFEYKKKKNN